MYLMLSLSIRAHQRPDISPNFHIIPYMKSVKTVANNEICYSLMYNKLMKRFMKRLNTLYTLY